MSIIRLYIDEDAMDRQSCVLVLLVMLLILIALVVGRWTY